MNTTLPDRQFSLAAARFFAPPYQILSISPTSGWSGSWLARVQDSTGNDWLLRRWPPSFDEAQLRLIHRVLQTSQRNRFDGAPKVGATADGATVLQLHGYLFDAQSQMPGRPLASPPASDLPMPNLLCELSAPQMTAFGKMLARFHQSVATLAPDSPTQCTSLAQRLTATFTAYAELSNRIQPEQPVQGATTTKADQLADWLRFLPQVLNRAAAILNAHTEAAQRIDQLCHGDLWPAHLFAADGELTGLIDFEMVGFTSAAADLAQAILHFGGWAKRDTLLDGYVQIRPITGEIEAVLPAAALLDLAGEGIWSLGELCRNDLASAQREAHWGNLAAFYPSAEALL